MREVGLECLALDVRMRICVLRGFGLPGCVAQSQVGAISPRAMRGSRLISRCCQPISDQPRHHFLLNLEGTFWDWTFVVRSDVLLGEHAELVLR